ncbi:hypothetical protein LQ948_06840 [Jiella sp. MQZ9-1]|uniref:Uncharacterized protein n=1 Tax=Jiella flava TaxID=2816857 RepID=A0A939FVK8_9HYPH|nr:hypothetical protein [Jiella flava]MBO0662250.1 hypothetical protein [Jiella flava]MCD2470919.1 hypothetical protein [Jiella flava]
MPSAIEQSLRRAFTKGNAQDPDFRLQIYEAAERALLRLEADQDTSEDVKDEHRRALIAAIEHIEAEFAKAEADPEAADGAIDEDHLRAAEPIVSDQSDPASNAASPSLDPDEAAAHEQAIRTAEGEPTPQDAARSERLSKLSRKAVGAIILLLFLFLIGAAVWIVMPLFSSPVADGASGAKQSDAEGRMSVAEAIRENAGTTASITSSQPHWINVYSPDALAQFATSDDAIAAAKSPNGEDALMLTSPETSGGGEVELPISGEIARRFAGKTVEGEIVVGSPDGKPRSFTLRCLFGADTVCGRQRFTTRLPEENFLFRLAFPPEAVAGGQIAVDPSVGDGEPNLLFYGLRLGQSS